MWSCYIMLLVANSSWIFDMNWCTEILAFEFRVFKKKEWMSSWVAAAYCCFPPMFYRKMPIGAPSGGEAAVCVPSICEGWDFMAKKSWQITWDSIWTWKKTKALAKLSRLLRQEAKIWWLRLFQMFVKVFFFGWYLTKKGGEETWGRQAKERAKAANLLASSESCLTLWQSLKKASGNLKKD